MPPLRNSPARAVSLAFAAICLAGCIHVPPGGVTEAGVEFGVAPLFKVKKDLAGVKVTNTKITAGLSTTQVQVFNFTWESYAKDISLTNPPKEP